MIKSSPLIRRCALRDRNQQNTTRIDPGSVGFATQIRSVRRLVDAADIATFKEDVVAFRVVGLGIAFQDERFFGHLVNCLDQLGIVFVAGPIDPP